MQTRAFHRLLAARLSEHLATGKAPRIPAGGDMTWQWFLDLNGTRGQGFAGALAITFCEIVAYRKMTGAMIRPDHVEAIMAMDRAYLDHVFDRAPADRSQPKRGSPLTAKAFDAMMG